MIEKIGEGVLRITLPCECTIADVEGHLDALRSRIEGVSRLELRAESLREIDTAYLQLLLSLKATLDERDVPLVLSGLCGPLDEALKLFGRNER